MLLPDVLVKVIERAIGALVKLDPDVSVPSNAWLKGEVCTASPRVTVPTKSNVPELNPELLPERVTFQEMVTDEWAANKS